VDQLKEFQKKYIEFQAMHHYDPNSVINIDETGICLDMPAHQTLNLKVKYLFNSFIKIE